MRRCDIISGCGNIYSSNLDACPHCSTPEAFSSGMEDYIYDIETYPNVFTLSAEEANGSQQWVFEISERRNDSNEMLGFFNSLRNIGARMVGFNNLHFDYPVVHLGLNMGYTTAPVLYDKAQAIFATPDNDKFRHTVWENDWWVPQIDLFKIHHFDNVARSTSLKALEFAMRSGNIQDLPFEPGTHLTSDQIDDLIDYNLNGDVKNTKRFYHASKDMINFREELTLKYGKNFLNHNDTKIGKDYFIMELEKAMPGSCYVKGPSGRVPRQTIRNVIDLGEAVFPYIQFMNPEFQRMKDWISHQKVTGTKGVFDNMVCTVGGLEYKFTQGGMHASVKDKAFYSNNEYALIDLDVTSYYPSLAIANQLHPAHLDKNIFCGIYADMKSQRINYAKDTPENAMLKLALNGSFGDTNNRFSPFYDPLCTMQITINGQLLLCMLSEQLLTIPGLQVLQVNTDGLTVHVKREHVDNVNFIRHEWERFTCLELEEVRYSRMFIRDVNSYIAEYDPACPINIKNKTGGKLKRKGAYSHETNLDKSGTGEVGWNQNHSSLIVAKAAEAFLIHGTHIRDFIYNHTDFMDFMLLVKVNRATRLVLKDDEGNEYPVQRTTRYYITKSGLSLYKIMKPLAANPEVYRYIGVCVGWRVTVCNNIKHATAPINYDYYVAEANKLVRMVSDE